MKTQSLDYGECKILLKVSILLPVLNAVLNTIQGAVWGGKAVDRTAIFVLFMK